MSRLSHLLHSFQLTKMSQRLCRTTVVPRLAALWHWTCTCSFVTSAASLLTILTTEMQNDFEPCSKRDSDFPSAGSGTNIEIGNGAGVLEQVCILFISLFQFGAGALKGLGASTWVGALGKFPPALGGKEAPATPVGSAEKSARGDPGWEWGGTPGESSQGHRNDPLKVFDPQFGADGGVDRV